LLNSKLDKTEEANDEQNQLIKEMDDVKAKHAQSIIDLQDKERDIAGYKNKLSDLGKELKEVNKKYEKVKSTLS
jgi:uncharacterized coiled-coil DUF342 family protein